MIHSDDKSGLENFYNAQKGKFVKWANYRFSCDQDTIIDVYQDAIVTLYFNIKEKKITEFESTPEAYLFGIARNLLLKKSIKSKRVQLEENVHEIAPNNIDLNIYDRIEEDHQKYQLKNAINQLKDSCKEIILLYYYKKFSLEAIANRLNYNNSDTVKARKNQCMNHLRKLLKNKN